MKKIVCLALLAAALTGCGGGGTAGTASGGTGSQLQTGPTSATVTLSTRAATAATVLYAAHFELPFPAGVTVTPDAAGGGTSGVPANGALSAADSGAQVATRYVAATGTTPGYLVADIYDAGGFTVGRLATITCAVARGAPVTADGFTLSGFSAWDADGAVMSGIDAQLQVQLQ